MSRMFLGAALGCATLGLQAAELNGRIVDERQQPVAGARVSLPALGASTQTDDNGRFSFDELADGRFDAVIQVGDHRR